MTIRYQIEPEKELIEVVVDGRIGVGELIRMMRDLLDDPAFDAAYDSLADCQTAQLSRVSFGLAEAIIAIFAGNEARRVAIVVPDNESAEIAEKFVTLRDDSRRARTFADRPSAEAWLAAP
ncbi:unnamed protein product, partial [Laminaria digitata]